MSKHNSIALFGEMCEQCHDLFERKNAQYGDSIWKTGVLGAVIELIGITARLPQLVLRDSNHGRLDEDNLKDIFMDIHNYAAIALMMLETDNWEGED